MLWSSIVEEFLCGKCGGEVEEKKCVKACVDRVVKSV